MRAAALALLFGSTSVAAEPNVCHVVDVDFQPASRTDLRPGHNLPPQIVAWVEDAAGAYVTTIFVTDEIGRRGLGNRPGRFDFNSGPLWPYGRRTTTFPIWSHRHDQEFGTVVFRDGNENNLSHRSQECSLDHHYCRPMQSAEPAYDALSCASPNDVKTDKGKLDTSRVSKYPPRSDLTFTVDDDPSILAYTPNPFDAISQATPPVEAQALVQWAVPRGLAAGDYVLFVEVAKEFDHNATYSVEAFPSPTAIPWLEYGEPYRGQPSVVYRVPFTLADAAGGDRTLVAHTATYAGYGDPDGLDGDVRAPDATITSDQPGSGASRLALLQPSSGPAYRVRVTSRLEIDGIAPAAPFGASVDDVTSSTATITFSAPGDDGMQGTVSRYDVRYLVGGEMTEELFATATRFTEDPLAPQPAGGTQAFTLTRLLPETTYVIGIRAHDNCHNESTLTIAQFTTEARLPGEVDACFIATAAYGSPLAAEVERLRGLRDRVLRKTVLGELAVEAYYTFSPAVAGVVGESELLRATARTLLYPIVSVARTY